MGRTKLGGTPSSRKDMYVCPVRSCKSNPRGDTWTTHWNTQVIFDDTDSGYAKDPKNDIRRYCSICNVSFVNPKAFIKYSRAGHRELKEKHNFFKMKLKRM